MGNTSYVQQCLMGLPPQTIFTFLHLDPSHGVPSHTSAESRRTLALPKRGADNGSGASVSRGSARRVSATVRRLGDTASEGGVERR